jgi:hypothetical protein
MACIDWSSDKPITNNPRGFEDTAHLQPGMALSDRASPMTAGAITRDPPGALACSIEHLSPFGSAQLNAGKLDRLPKDGRSRFGNSRVQ